MDTEVDAQSERWRAAEFFLNLFRTSSEVLFLGDV